MTTPEIVNRPAMLIPFTADRRARLTSWTGTVHARRLARGRLRRMLVWETVARIRCEFHVKRDSMREIVRDLRVSWNMVRKAPRPGDTHFSHEWTVRPLQKLGR